MRLKLLLAAGILMAVSCSPIAEERPDLQPMLELPAEYGNLVAVTQHHENSEWYELWFCDQETGVVTHVPLYRTTWSYMPERVRRIARTPAPLPQSTGGQP